MWYLQLNATYIKYEYDITLSWENTKKNIVHVSEHWKTFYKYSCVPTVRSK